MEWMRRPGFSVEEFAKLTEANSDALTRTEFAAMELIESASPATDADHSTAIRMLHHAACHQAKAGIMQTIGQFRRMADQRTLEAVRAAQLSIRGSRSASRSDVLCFGS